MNRRIFSFTLLLLMCVTLLRAEVTFRVSVPEGTKQCFVVGAEPSIGNWSPLSAVEMQSVGDQLFELTVTDLSESDLSSGFKYINGPDWRYVEKDADGLEISNRTSITENDVVLNWSEIYDQKAMVKSISFNGQMRDIQILLPETYDADVETSYPVVYMPAFAQRYRMGGDANEFGDAVFSSSSWDVATTMETISKNGGRQAIIVAIYARLEELTPWENSDLVGLGDGDEFMKGFVNDLVPYVNSNYRTISDPSQTAIAGGGAGGLMAFHIALNHQDLIGRCALFSPSFWLNEGNELDFLKTWNKTGLEKVYFAIGGKEMESIKANYTEVANALKASGFDDEHLVVAENPDGIFDDYSWGFQYDNAFNFIMDETYVNSEQMTKHAVLSYYANDLKDYRLMSGSSDDALTCDASASSQKIDFYQNGGDDLVEMRTVLIQEIGADVQSKYYWNLNEGDACDGATLLETNKSVGFKSSKSTTSWLRVVVDAEGTLESDAASASFFRLISGTEVQMMSQTKVDGSEGVDDTYTITATATFGEAKSFEIHTGSVNSGSDMGTIVQGQVSSSCLEAKISYSFLNNKITVEEIAWGGVLPGELSDFSLMSGVVEDSLECGTSSSSSKMDFYNNGEATLSSILVAEIPADVTSTYYWNLVRGSDCDGDTLFTENRSIGFKSKKSTTSWMRAVIDESDNVDVISASSEHFRLIVGDQTVLMTPSAVSGEYKVSADVTFEDLKQFSIHYGSVNSGSDMGEIAMDSITANCVEAEITYNFTNNEISIVELAWGEVQPSDLQDYRMMAGLTENELTCDVASANQKIEFFDQSSTDTGELKSVILYEVSADIKETLYWNLNIGTDCNGANFYDVDKSVGFKSKKTTESWLRIVIDKSGEVDSKAASSEHFRLIANGESYIMDQTMSDGSAGTDDTYTVSVVVDFASQKTFDVDYGSVNSGSDMGALLTDSVSSECIKAQISYSFLNNKLTINELAWGAPNKDPELTYFRAIPAVANTSTPIRISTRIENLNGYTLQYRMDHNFADTTAQAMTTADDGEQYFTIEEPVEGVYNIHMDLEKDGFITYDYHVLSVRVFGDDVQNDKMIFNPYESINWSNQYKGNFHTHTTQSNDAHITTSGTVDAYHDNGYTILAITDHDYNSYPWTMFEQFNWEVQNRNPENLGMLSIPGIEVSKDDRNSWSERSGESFNHHNVFFTGRQGQEFQTLEESYAYTEELGGLQILNHPGQYWKIENDYSDDSKRNSPGWFEEMFTTYSSIVGLEVFNQGNKWVNDRILWDQVLDRTMPSRPVFGYSNDDTHNTDQLFHGYQFMLLDDFSIEGLKKGMKEGATYFSYEPEGSGEAKAPRIQGIHVNEETQTITIDTDAEQVSWISSTTQSGGRETQQSAVVGYGKTFNYKNFSGSYVRARLLNADGETCTQPFGFQGASDHTSNDDFGQNIDTNITLYPNPTRGQLTLKVGAALIGETVRIFDLAGRVMHTQLSDAECLEFDTSNYPQGIYYLKIGNKNQMFIKK